MKNKGILAFSELASLPKTSTTLNKGEAVEFKDI